MRYRRWSWLCGDLSGTVQIPSSSSMAKVRDATAPHMFSINLLPGYLI